MRKKPVAKFIKLVSGARAMDCAKVSNIPCVSNTVDVFRKLLDHINSGQKHFNQLDDNLCQRRVKVLNVILEKCNNLLDVTDTNTLETTIQQIIKEYHSIVIEVSYWSKNHLINKSSYIFSGQCIMFEMVCFTISHLVLMCVVCQVVDGVFWQPQATIPDVMLWMYKGHRPIAYYRFPANSLLWSPEDKLRGSNCGKIHNVQLKVSNMLYLLWCDILIYIHSVCHNLYAPCVCLVFQRSMCTKSSLGKTWVDSKFGETWTSLVEFYGLDYTGWNSKSITDWYLLDSVTHNHFYHDLV